MRIGTKKTLSEGELAQLLDKSVATVRRWRKVRQGPAWMKIGKTVAYDPEDVAAYVEAAKHYPLAAA
jgi:predicted DNA-binding transcriptional regulator AlpA